MSGLPSASAPEPAGLSCPAPGHELTIHVAADLQPALQALAAEVPAGTDCLLDLAEVSEFDSAGLQLLLSLRRQLAAQGSALHLRHTRGPVREVLATLHLTAQLDPSGRVGAAPTCPEAS
jgi:anti-anti-sigma factor